MVSAKTLKSKSPKHKGIATSVKNDGRSKIVEFNDYYKIEDNYKS